MAEGNVGSNGKYRFSITALLTVIGILVALIGFVGGTAVGEKSTAAKLLDHESRLSRVESALSSLPEIKAGIDEINRYLRDSGGRR